MRDQQRWVVVMAVVLVLSGFGRDRCTGTEPQPAGPKRTVAYWTHSGFPEHQMRVVRAFMRLHPDTVVWPWLTSSQDMQAAIRRAMPDYVYLEGKKNPRVGGGGESADQRSRERRRRRRPRVRRPLFARLARVRRFVADPDDPLLRNVAKHPDQARRLLALHGKAIGIGNVVFPSTLTYNKRLFREAAKAFPDAGLVDARGEPIPPATWLELYEKAEAITAYGRLEAKRKGLDESACYGVAIHALRAPYDTPAWYTAAARRGWVLFPLPWRPADHP